MKLAPKTMKSISLKLKHIKNMLAINNGTQIEDIKNELYDIIQEIDEENHKCYINYEE
jgi:hypothetical protein